MRRKNIISKHLFKEYITVCVNTIMKPLTTKYKGTSFVAGGDTNYRVKRRRFTQHKVSAVRIESAILFLVLGWLLTKLQIQSKKN